MCKYEARERTPEQRVLVARAYRRSLWAHPLVFMIGIRCGSQAERGCGGGLFATSILGAAAALRKAYFTRAQRRCQGKRSLMRPACWHDGWQAGPRPWLAEAHPDTGKTAPRRFFCVATVSATA
ncbi:hypothetical protein MTO96_016750 [Rhipicephalus appendiculatus]